LNLRFKILNLYSSHRWHWDLTILWSAADLWSVRLKSWQRLIAWTGT
jgi:hypothetical protein